MRGIEHSGHYPEPKATAAQSIDVPLRRKWAAMRRGQRTVGWIIECALSSIHRWSDEVGEVASTKKAS